MKSSNLLKTANSISLRFNPFSLSRAVLAFALLLFCMLPQSHAAITGDGDLNPLDLTLWNYNTTCYIGQNASGSIAVDDGSKLISKESYMGYNSNSIGTAVISGEGSRWSTGVVIYIGYKGTGILNIEEGGMVQGGAIGGYLGYISGSHGSAIVKGTNSKLTFGKLYLGYYGSGNLDVTDGGSVDAGIIFGSLNSLSGNGTITTQGAVLDYDLVFDASHGVQQTHDFGSGGLLNLNLGDGATLGAGYKGSGSLKIADGKQISSSNVTLGYHAGSTGTATIVGPNTTWTMIGSSYVGYYGNGTLNIEAGAKILPSVSDGYLGYYPGSTGTMNVTGLDSQYSSGFVNIGYKGEGICNIEAGAKARSLNCYLGYDNNARGVLKVSGSGSSWTNDDDFYVGYSGSGSLIVENGGLVSNASDSFIGGSFNGGMSDCSATITGANSKWTNNGSLEIDSKGTTALSIEAGGQVSDAVAYLGKHSGYSGMATVKGLNSKWTNSNLHVGYSGSGVLNIEDGGQVIAAGATNSNYIGYDVGSTGTVSVSGKGSQWINDYSLYIGYSGAGTLNIKAGGLVNCTSVGLGTAANSKGAVLVSGAGSKWSLSNNLSIGGQGNGTLNIEDGGEVSCVLDDIGYSAKAFGEVAVTGTNSKLIVSLDLSVGKAGKGILSIKGGGVVTNRDCNLGSQTNSSGAITVTDANSKLISSGSLYVGGVGSGNMDILAGGQVSSAMAYVGNSTSSTGKVSVSGADSVWKNSGDLYLGYFGTGVLNIGNGIGSGGQVTAGWLLLGVNAGSSAICNLNGGTLTVGSLGTGSGTSIFNWEDGTIRNSGAKLMNVSSNTMKLAATGTHAFYIDQGCQCAAGGGISDATSGGTLLKLGGGKLIFSSPNTYTGSTTIDAGTLALINAGSLASNLIDVKSGATFDVFRAQPYSFSLKANQTLKGSGTIYGTMTINGVHEPGDSVGIETIQGNYSMLGELKIDLLGTNLGTQYDQVLMNGSYDYNATLGGTLTLNWGDMSDAGETAKLWILKNDTAGTLSGAFSNYANGASLGTHGGLDWRIYYNADAATGNPTGGNDVLIAPVPEPASIILLAISALAVFGWSRKQRVYAP